MTSAVNATAAANRDQNREAPERKASDAANIGEMVAAMDANRERAESAVSGRPTADDDLVACPAIGFGPAVGSAGAIGRIEPIRNNALKRQPASGPQNRNASGFRIPDKANPGRVTRAMVRQQGLKPCPAIGKRLWSQVGSFI